MTDESNDERAASTFEALYSPRLFSKRTCLWGRRKFWLLRNNEALWSYADAWSAVCTLAAPEGQARIEAALPGFLRGLRAYHRGSRSTMASSDPIGFESFPPFPHGPGGDVFYDDNTWLGLALCHHHELTSSDEAADLSRRVLDFVLTGWSTDTTWSHPGGIRWKVPVSNRSRNTCSNAPVAELAALIARRDGDETQLDWAKRIYAWVHESLGGNDGLYFDQIAPDGTLLPDIWSYNQGTMIGAGVMLHLATDEADYLTQAESTAQAALNHFSVDRFVGQDAAFNAVFFRNLLLLDAISPDPAYRSLANEYGDRMWTERRDPLTGLFSGGNSFLNNTAPMIQIYALLSGSAPHP
jgi:uncharacterized protein YyaL (SSP411 family)